MEFIHTPGSRCPIMKDCQDSHSQRTGLCFMWIFTCMLRYRFELGIFLNDTTKRVLFVILIDRLATGLCNINDRKYIAAPGRAITIATHIEADNGTSTIYWILLPAMTASFSTFIYGCWCHKVCNSAVDVCCFFFVSLCCTHCGFSLHIGCFMLILMHRLSSSLAECDAFF